MKLKPLFIVVFAVSGLLVPALIWLTAWPGPTGKFPDAPGEARGAGEARSGEYRGAGETSSGETSPKAKRELDLERLLGIAPSSSGSGLAKANVTRGDILALVTRLENLERQLQRLDRTADLHDLRTRVTTLERAIRFDQKSASSTPSSSIRSGDLTQTKRQVAALAREQDQIASRVSSLETRTFRPQTELASLERKLHSLESTVRRLESR